MDIRSSFTLFQQTHIHLCTSIPRDLRECYTHFKFQEEQAGVAVENEDEFVWVSSAIRRGFRDDTTKKEDGGIIYCSELAAASNDQELNVVPVTTTSSAAAVYSVEESPYKVEGIYRPHQHDVIVWPSKNTMQHAGNTFWRHLVLNLKPKYDASPTETKALLSKLIVKVVREDQSPPGRFLALDKLTGLYNDIGDDQAIFQTSASFGTIHKRVGGGAVPDWNIDFVKGAAPIPFSPIIVTDEDTSHMEKVHDEALQFPSDLFNEEIDKWIDTVSLSFLHKHTRVCIQMLYNILMSSYHLSFAQCSFPRISNRILQWSNF